MFCCLLTFRSFTTVIVGGMSGQQIVPQSTQTGITVSETVAIMANINKAFPNLSLKEHLFQDGRT